MAVASPVDQKSPTTQAYPLDTQKSGDAVPLNKAPLSPSTVDLHPLNKRDTPKTQTSSVSNSQKQPAVVAAVTADKKENIPKVTSPNRKTRDTAQKTSPTVTSVNQQPQKSSSQAKPAVTSTNNSKKTREAPKPDDTKKTPVNSSQQKVPANNAPQVARAPLTSTNTRPKRDAPKVTVSSPAANVKAENTQSKPSNSPVATNDKPKKDSTNTQTQSNNGSQSGYRRPAPVDQVLRQKAAATTEA